MIRLATNQDCDGIVALVDAVYREYGEQMCLEQADQDLLDVVHHYFDKQGCFWVLEMQGKIRGSHGAFPEPDQSGVCRFKRLYLDRELRGSDWGRQLMQVTVDWAEEQGFEEIQFWSDSRFKRAHRFFEKFGFKPDGRMREMLDGHEPYYEHFYSMGLKSSSETTPE